MPETPMPNEKTINAAIKRINRALDNEGIEDDLREIAEDDPNMPDSWIDGDISDDDLETPEEFQDRIFAQAILKIAYERSSLIADFIDNTAEYLEVHNSREALGGYMNDLSSDLNPILLMLGKSPITIQPVDDLTTD